MSKKTTIKRATPAGPAVASLAGPARATTSPAQPAARRAEVQQDQVAQRAYGLYEQRGRQDGWDLDDWLQAERQLAGASGRS